MVREVAKVRETRKTGDITAATLGHVKFCFKLHLPNRQGVRDPTLKLPLNRLLDRTLRYSIYTNFYLHKKRVPFARVHDKA